jgi:hypothetical protein
MSEYDHTAIVFLAFICMLGYCIIKLFKYIYINAKCFILYSFGLREERFHVSESNLYSIA